MTGDRVIRVNLRMQSSFLQLPEPQGSNFSRRRSAPLVSADCIPKSGSWQSAGCAPATRLPENRIGKRGGLINKHFLLLIPDFSTCVTTCHKQAVPLQCEIKLKTEPGRSGLRRSEKPHDKKPLKTNERWEQPTKSDAATAAPDSRTIPNRATASCRPGDYVETETAIRCPACHKKLNTTQEEFARQVEVTYEWE